MRRSTKKLAPADYHAECRRLEACGAMKLSARGAGIFFGDPLTSDELRSLYAMTEFVREHATPAEAETFKPGAEWLSMFFRAAASVLPRRFVEAERAAFEERNKPCPPKKSKKRRTR